jgi:hypothetical protein
MAEENKKVNVWIPGDHASGILALAEELRRYQETDAEEALRRTDTVQRIIKTRVAVPQLSSSSRIISPAHLNSLLQLATGAQSRLDAVLS